MHAVLVKLQIINSYCDQQLLYAHVAVGWPKGQTGHKRPFLPLKSLGKQLGKLKQTDINNSKMVKACTCVFKNCSKDRNEPWSINVRGDFISSLSRVLFLLLGLHGGCAINPQNKNYRRQHTQEMLPDASWGRVVPMSQGVLASGKNGDNHLFKPVDVRRASSLL